MKRKQNNSILQLLLIGVLLALASGCRKDDPEPNNPTNGKTTAIFNPDITYGTLTDQDDNTYKTVVIGTQTWMAENLRTTRYNDGSPIPNVTVDEEWNFLSAGAYCNYKNSVTTDTIATYGRLYNWYAVNTTKLCPAGWHVPSTFDWVELADYLGDASGAGGKLKETGTTHWESPNTGATNETGFTALPGGHRYFTGAFYDIGHKGFWWSSTEYIGISAAYLRIMNFSNSELFNYISNKEVGYSVRCVKD